MDRVESATSSPPWAKTITSRSPCAAAGVHTFAGQVVLATTSASAVEAVPRVSMAFSVEPTGAILLGLLIDLVTRRFWYSAWVANWSSPSWTSWLIRSVREILY